VFTGLGRLGSYHITLHDSHQPVINPYFPLTQSQVTVSIGAKCSYGSFKVDQPTDWVSNLVVVEKQDGSLQLCLDPQDLNKTIKLEHYKIPTMEEIAAKFARKTVFFFNS